MDHSAHIFPPMFWKKTLTKKLETLSGLVGFWLVRDAHSDHGFLTSGSKDERLRFTRLYLDSHDVKSSFSPKLSLDQTTFLLEMRQRYGLVILDGYPVPKRLEGMVLRIPKFVSLIIDVPANNEELLPLLPVDRRRSYKFAIARDVEAKFTRSMDFVSEFVERYHGPTIHRSHGEEGNVLSPRHLRKMLQSPDNEFMLLFLGSECIKAGFCLRQGTTYRMYATGWLRGPTENLKGNMQCVAIWKALNRARELACDVLDLGGTPPFLDDGVFNFKMRWNARLNQSRLTYGSHCLLIDPAHPKIQSFFASHPTIVYDRHNKLCILSAKKPSEVQLRPSILEGISSWWRLVCPEEAQERDLSKAPTQDMPSGWCVRETLR
ncbi:MAG: hypothetical protein ACOYKN_13900 [Pirellula sp.]